MTLRSPIRGIHNETLHLASIDCAIVLPGNSEIAGFSDHRKYVNTNLPTKLKIFLFFYLRKFYCLDGAHFYIIHHSNRRSWIWWPFRGRHFTDPRAIGGHRNGFADRLDWHKIPITKPLSITWTSGTLETNDFTSRWPIGQLNPFHASNSCHAPMNSHILTITYDFCR